ncbi:sugar phosphate isomerase/epimerase family protein [Candidatus Sumerlaeota bacterium]
MTEKKIPVALQLYSIRDMIEDDIPGRLKELADMGYDAVEFAGYYGLRPAELRQMLDDCGLKCAGSHTGLQTLAEDQFEATVEMNKTLGTDLMIIPGGLLGDDMSEAVDNAMKLYERCKAAGMRTGFHNHKGEFDMVDGKTKLDHLFENTPEDFIVQCDIGWAAAAGADVPAFLRKYANRLETVHVKEHSEQDPTAPVGEGVLDWPMVFDILEQETVCKWYTVEQEAYADNSMASAKDCINNLRKMGR